MEEREWFEQNDVDTDLNCSTLKFFWCPKLIFSPPEILLLTNDSYRSNWEEELEKVQGLENVIEEIFLGAK